MTPKSNPPSGFLTVVADDLISMAFNPLSNYLN
jgi:hypothetical protein